MSFFTDLNKYIKTLSDDWFLIEDSDNGYVLHLYNTKTATYIEIEFHQEMIVRDGKAKPYNWGNVGLDASGNLPFEQAEKIVYDLNEIMRKNT